MKKARNEMNLQIEAKSVNEAFARYAVSAFAAQLDPSVVEITDLRTVVSEAVTNCIIHGYRGAENGIIYITASYYDDRTFRVKIRDKGCGMEDLELCMQPFYSGDASGERGGMGFTIMDSFTDKMRVTTRKGKGTTVILTKRFK